MYIKRKPTLTMYYSLKGLDKFPASAAWKIYTHSQSEQLRKVTLSLKC